MSLRGLYLLGNDVPWWRDLQAFAERDDVETRGALLRAMLAGGHADPWEALADALLYGDGVAWSVPSAHAGVAAALRADVATMAEALSTLHDVLAMPEGDAPPVADLGDVCGGEVQVVARLLRSEASADHVVTHVRSWRAAHGGGYMARFAAFAWEDGTLVGVTHPAQPDLAELLGVDAQLASLRRNTEAFVEGGSAMDVLLYGPRGSGKSTVVRGLLREYAHRGLRLVALPSAALVTLPHLLERLEGRPERFIVYVDDLAFEDGDARYQPFKSLLEGGVRERPANVRVYATSNRRHLVQERLRDRPDPLDDDVHAWDTQHERLALADRFGLVLTFPASDRDAYLAIVRALLQREAPELAGDGLHGRADRFARSNNGYSGRTARQFVDAARAGVA